ncbi:MAG: FKBP-type peptidyl-prolyl cis-trans isomerase [Candidatus Parabeggiatoa sp. nov. 1]|nr:MAG: FKBP-type peptidyl-prolyl cis-trans isomerase [Gammaproteobacteria bacterium]
MKLRCITVLSLGLLTAQVSAEEPQTLTSPKDKLSYSFGQQFGQNISKYLQQQHIALDLNVVAKGIKHALHAKSPLLSQREIRQTMIAFQQRRFARLAKKNLEEGKAFLAKKAKTDGVVTLPSGLQYKVITAGTGKTPKLTDKVTTHYRGTLINGTEFDSSYKRGEPATFPVQGVIAGWTEALQLMKEGAKWKLFIPAKLAYGKPGKGGKIGPNATLIFKIELLSVGE